MKRFAIVWVLIFLGFTGTASPAADLKLIDQWIHKGQVFKGLYDGVVDKDNHIALCYGAMQFALVSKEHFTPFAYTGHPITGLTSCNCYFKHGPNLAFLDGSDQLKIFYKRSGTYFWKETQHFEDEFSKENKHLLVGSSSQHVSDGVFFDNKFFFSGETTVTFEEGGDAYFKYFLLRVFDAKGKFLKNLIKFTYKETFHPHYFRYHLVPYKNDRMFFIPANELTVSVISPQSLRVAQEVRLEVPPFYKKMSPDCYVMGNSYSYKRFERDLKKWDMGYSRITRCRIDGNYLVIQLRTCEPQSKKFALLFYNAESFTLENTIYTNDFLLDIKDGKYYFYANGEPGRDDDENVGEDCIITIYQLEENENR